MNKQEKRLSLKIDIKKSFSEKQAWRDYVLPGLQAGTVGCLYSKCGANKLFFAVEALLEIVDGGSASMMDLGVKTTDRVVYLSLEDPESITAERLHEMGAHLSKAARDIISEGLDILPLAGMGFDIFDPKWFGELLNYCTGARLVIFDTLSRVASVDYNDPAQARQVMRRMGDLAKQTGAAVLFLHHVSKVSIRAVQGTDQPAVTGASAPVNDTRLDASLTIMSADDYVCSSTTSP
ncbi:regulatory protein RepA [mine drainage metagenome]|uniref:Regulatory protein RepA n=1 Tax=mine drainage metagenome TaxID=410659 RepID=A0A1J5PIT8_9ZZZZ